MHKCKTGLSVQGEQSVEWVRAKGNSVLGVIMTKQFYIHVWK
jgi:hypothetical protein